MSHFAIHDTNINLATGIAVVTVGCWVDAPAQRSGAQPVNTRQLSCKPGAIDEATYEAVTALANAHDWRQSAAGSAHVVDADGAVIPQPERPGPHHVWDWGAKAWADPRTLQDLKDAKWAAMKRCRDTLEATSFPYLGKAIDSDMLSVLRINTVVKAAEYAQSQGAPFATEWRCADNTLLALDGPALQMMPVALAAHSQALHSHANTLRAQIEAATTPADLAEVVWG